MIDCREYALPPAETIRILNIDDVASILKNPVLVIVVDALGDSVFIAKQSENCRLVEEVKLSCDASNWLLELQEESVLFYSPCKPTNASQLTWPHFFDIWREEYLPLQPTKGLIKAMELGLSIDGLES